MAGINRADLDESRVLAKALNSANEKPCIFLSHISLDKSAVKAVGDYITQHGDIDIYLDLYDSDLQSAVNNNDAHGITEFIEKGIRSSTHIMCLFSESTVRSWWVPYEIGYGKRSSCKVSSLKLKGEVELPAYLDVSKLLLGTDSLNRYLRGIVNTTQITKGAVSLNESIIPNHQMQHPLDAFLDWSQ